MAPWICGNKLRQKESRAEVQSIHLDYVTQDVDDDAVVDHIGYRVDFVDKKDHLC